MRTFSIKIRLNNKTSTNHLMIKAIIFDLDNTLIDFWKMKSLSVEKAVDAMIKAGLKMRKEKALEEIYAIYDKRGYEERFIFQEFMENHGKIDYRIIARGIVAYKNEWSKRIVPYPKVEETLAKLKEDGLKLGVITDAPRMKAWQRLVGMGIDKYFDFMIALEDCSRRKPHPLPFKIAIRMSGFKPGEMMMVGDWIEKDVIGAGNVGMKTCLAEYGNQSYGSKRGSKEIIKPDYRIKSFDELIGIVG